MLDDERAIRDLIAKWMQATKAGDTETVRQLNADRRRGLLRLARWIARYPTTYR